MGFWVAFRGLGFFRGFGGEGFRAKFRAETQAKKLDLILPSSQLWLQSWAETVSRDFRRDP